MTDENYTAHIQVVAQTKASFFEKTSMLTMIRNNDQQLMIDE